MLVSYVGGLLNHVKKLFELIQVWWRVPGRVHFSCCSFSSFAFTSRTNTSSSLSVTLTLYHMMWLWALASQKRPRKRAAVTSDSNKKNKKMNSEKKLRLPQWAKPFAFFFYIVFCLDLNFCFVYCVSNDKTKIQKITSYIMHAKWYHSTSINMCQWQMWILLFWNQYGQICWFSQFWAILNNIWLNIQDI